MLLEGFVKDDELIRTAESLLYYEDDTGIIDVIKQINDQYEGKLEIRKLKAILQGEEKNPISVFAGSSLWLAIIVLIIGSIASSADFYLSSIIGVILIVAFLVIGFSFALLPTTDAVNNVHNKNARIKYIVAIIDHYLE